MQIKQKIKKLLFFINNNKKFCCIFTFVLLLGFITRLYKFNQLPAGTNQDEAFALYESYSILKTGYDSWGYHLPVYFISWGDGMNTLNSYLALPFVALLGAKTIAIRIPNLIMSCISIIMIYKFIFLLTKNKKYALIGMFFFSICPYFIMASRWAVESLLAPHMILYSSYFLLKGISNNKYYIVASILFGLTLYTYAVCWIIVVLILLFFLIYLFKTKSNIINKYTIISSIILFSFALPLLLFILINKNIIPEIKSFISIPKMLNMRDGEISIKNIPTNLYYYVHYCIGGKASQVNTKFGYYYIWGFILSILGEINCLYDKKKRLFGFLYLISFAYLMSLKDIGGIKINIIHMFNVITITNSLIIIYKKNDIFKYVFKIVIVLMIISFANFEYHYNINVSYNFGVWNTFFYGYESSINHAIDIASKNNTNNIYFADENSHFSKYFPLLLKTAAEKNYTVDYKYIEKENHKAWLQYIKINNINFIFEKKYISENCIIVSRRNYARNYYPKEKYIEFENYAVINMQ